MENLKALFINSIFKIERDTFPIGLVSLCSILKNAGYEVDIVDFSVLTREHRFSKSSFENCDIEAFAKYILSLKPVLLSFYTMANSMHVSLALAKYIKETQSDIKVIFAGPQASVCAEDLMCAFSFIDLIAIGEGESTVESLFYALKNELDFSAIPGIVYRSGKNVKQNPLPSLIGDLDELPMLDLSFVPSISNFKRIMIEVGRGCPYGCAFCSTNFFWERKYRLKSNKRILKEVSEMKNLYNISEFSFLHDSITADKKKFRDLCEKIITEEMYFSWSCSSRVDLLDRELISLMSKAGCRSIFIGIESGSPRVQKLIKKNLNLGEVQPVVRSLIENNIEVTASFMYGFPGENEDDVSLTLEMIHLLLTIGVKTVQIHPLSVLRGTELYSKHKHELRIDRKSKLFSNFCFGGNSSAYADMFADYPSIFPQFYEITSANKKLANLHCFVNYIMNKLYSSCKLSFGNMVNFYDGNLLRIFFAFDPYIDEIEDGIIKISDQKLTLNEFWVLILELVLRFFESSFFGDKDFEYKCCYKFEFDFNMFCLSMKENQIVKYDFDATRLYSDYENFTELLQVTNIKFVRVGNKVRFKKVLSHQEA